jgi:hypothetical protein
MRLSLRQLNRAVLDRQHLLDRVDLPVTDAVEQVFGLNAQSPNLPYVALWSRLTGFAIKDLTTALEDRSLVRSTLMRATQHIVSVADFGLVRAAVALLLRRVQRNAFGSRTKGVDLDALVSAARELLADRVLTRPELGRLLAPRWPDADPNGLGWTVQYLLPLVHPAPSGTWGVYGATPFAAAWTEVPTEPDLPELVRRYLAAFGPATVADARAWSGVSGLREVFAGMDLRRHTSEDGRELYDLPEATLPDPATPAPVRLLPEFDAPLLAYHDRTRMMTDDVRRAVCVGAGVAATVLVDGVVAATWSTAVSDGTAVLTVHPFGRPTPATRTAVTEEALALLAFTHPDDRHELRLPN